MDKNEKSQKSKAGISHNLEDIWDTSIQAVVCDHCDWSYLVPQERDLRLCPHCYRTALTPLNQQIDELPYTRPPELVLQFQVSAERLASAIAGFTRGIPFPPQDLKPEILRGRLNRVFIPMWLVDASVGANWQAEAGFDYEVVSHQDRYNENRGGWVSRQVREWRIRWEPRAGRLGRDYDNIVAPALDDDGRLKDLIGQFELPKATAYNPQDIKDCVVRLPNRSQEDAWPDAKPGFWATAADECRQASGADHIREFTWVPKYGNQHWTLLLLPLLSTYYLDDDDRPQAVLVNGRTGEISGVRRASMDRGQRATLILLSIALILFMASVLMSFGSLLLPGLLVLGVTGFILSLLVGVGSLVPIASVWWFNRTKRS